MTLDEKSVRQRNPYRLRLVLGLSAAGLIAAALVVFLSTRDAGPSGGVATTADESEEAVRARVRDTLARAPDADTCRATLEQLNTFLERHPARKPAPLAASERDRLAERFGLGREDLAEIDSPSFTALDGYHLDLCLLLRDAARAQGLKPSRTADEARQAFAWVMREVRLRPGEGEPLPPAHVLRRGWGTAEERALVFLSLLHQLRIPGCALAYHTEEAGKRSVHYCLTGALVGKDIELFDPRLGLPLPGPKGDGVATLAQLKKADGADILPRLTSDPAHPYDLTAEQVKHLEVCLAPSLTSLAPRMRYLQNDILGFDLSPDTAQVAADSQEFEHFQEATRSLDVPIRGWPEATRALRSFLPREQGGTDTTGGPRTMSRQLSFEWTLIPWHVLPVQIVAMPDSMRGRMLQIYTQPFQDFYLAPRQPRDLILRGRYDEATRTLVGMRDDIDDHRARGPAYREAEKRFPEWARQFIDVNAQLIQAGGPDNPAARDAREQVERVWREGQPILMELIGVATAEPRGSEVTYQLALCTHERAARAQAHAGRGGPGARNAEEAWKEAVYWWDKFETNDALTTARYRNRAAQIQGLEQARAQALRQSLARDLSTAVNARLLHAEALTRRGQPEPAKKLLEDLARDLKDLAGDRKDSAGEQNGRDDLAAVEKADEPGAARWYLVGVREQIRRLTQAP